MERKNLLKPSLILGFFLFAGIHIYYPHDPSIVIGKTAAITPLTEFNINSVFSFFFAILVEYFIVVFAVYVFLRGVLKTLEKNMRSR